MRWTDSVDRIGEVYTAYVLVGKSRMKDYLVRGRGQGQHKNGSLKMRCEYVDWIKENEIRVQWHGVVSAIMKLLLP
jgi:hypothetical protein